MQKSKAHTPVYTPPKQTGFYLDPRTKILFMAFISTLMIFVYENLMIDTLITVIALLLLLSNAQRRIALIYGGLFACALAAKLFQGTVQLPTLLNVISVLLIGLVIRLFPIFMLGYYTVRSTKTNEFIAAMLHWHIPEAFIIPISVVFRFIPTMQEESAAIKHAMKMRGIQLGSKKARQNPALYVEYRIIPLLLSVVKIGEELSAAALTRGLGGINNPDASVGVCCSHKEVAVGFNTLCYDAERCRETAGIKPSARIKMRTSITVIRFGIYDALIALASSALLVLSIFT